MGSTYRRQPQVGCVKPAAGWVYFAQPSAKYFRGGILLHPKSFRALLGQLPTELDRQLLAEALNL
jgi:hypothetical protein